MSGEGFSVVNVGGVGYKIYTSLSSGRVAERGGEWVKFYTYLNVKEDALDIYGFTDEFELLVFKKLIGISGVGPKSALSVLNMAEAKEIVAAINEGRAELLTKVAGIGKKTAERVVLELKGKIETPRAGETIKKMEANADVEEALMSLGYARGQVREATDKVPEKIVGFQERFKAALKNLGKNKKIL